METLNYSYFNIMYVSASTYTNNLMELPVKSLHLPFRTEFMSVLFHRTFSLEESKNTMGSKSLRPLKCFYFAVFSNLIQEFSSLYMYNK